MDNEPLREKEWVKDLGVIIDKGMTFVMHITQLIQKTRRTMGFLMRNTGNFKNIQTFLTLYFALIRSNLEFAALIWNPHTATHTNSIEQIQKGILRFLYLKTFDYYPSEIPYEELLRGFQIKSLENRRKIGSLLLLYDILKGTNTITNPDLLSRINIHVPRVCSKYGVTFLSARARTNILKYSTLNRAMEMYDLLLHESPDVDIFYLTREKFKKLLINAY